MVSELQTKSAVLGYLKEFALSMSNIKYCVIPSFPKHQTHPQSDVSTEHTRAKGAGNPGPSLFRVIHPGPAFLPPGQSAA